MRSGRRGSRSRAARDSVSPRRWSASRAISASVFYRELPLPPLLPNGGGSSQTRLHIRPNIKATHQSSPKSATPMPAALKTPKNAIASQTPSLVQ